jgi:arsenate reductase-like glutaredoxin family protein
MDVERYLLGTALMGIISQRLAKRLCPKCRKARPVTKYEKIVFQKALGLDVKEIYEPVRMLSISVRELRGLIRKQSESFRRYSEPVRMLSISVRELGGLVRNHSEPFRKQTEPFLSQSNPFRSHIFLVHWNSEPIGKRIKENDSPMNEKSFG